MKVYIFLYLCYYIDSNKGIKKIKNREDKRMILLTRDGINGIVFNSSQIKELTDWIKYYKEGNINYMLIGKIHKGGKK